MSAGPAWTALACALVAGGANVTGGLLGARASGWDRIRQSYLVAVGAGFMLAAVLLRMVPESYRLALNGESAVLSVGTLILVGYLLVHFAEHVLVAHFHFGEETHHEHWVEPVVGTTALMGLALHTLFDGISIGSGFLIDPGLGLLIAIAVFLHKVPEGFTMASIMVAAGRTRRDAILAASFLGVMTVVGTLGTTLLRGSIRIALPVSAGAAIYVAASDLIPAVNEAKGIKKPLGVFAGVLLFYATELILSHLGL